MASSQQSMFGFEVERVERPGTGASVETRSTGNRPKRLTKSAVVGVVERVERSAEECPNARVIEGASARTPARVSDIENGRSTRSTRSTDANPLVAQGVEVERVDESEPVPPRSTEENHEICSLEVRYLADLPLPTTLTLDVPGVGVVLVSTSQARVERERRAGARVWAPLGFELAAYAFQVGRARPSEWQAWCGHLASPDWRLTAAVALGGAVGLEGDWRAARRPPVREPRITLGRFLHVSWSRLLDARVEDASGAAEAAEVPW